MDMTKINHLGIIVDGNGRWAKKRGLSRSEGHKAGAEALKNIILYLSREKKVKYLSLYVFSTENFARPKEEVNYLMELFLKWFKTVKKEYRHENIKVLFSGNRDLLDTKIVNAMNDLEKETMNNDGLIVNFCLSYGGRNELVDATKKIAQKVLDGELSISQIDEVTIADNLYQQLPDIDFLIRTSGENRVSNFMLWQISYAEFYFPKVLFPDFDIEELNKAFVEFENRDRRFGKVK